MNVRSFSDLNDILIQSDDIVEENKVTNTTEDAEEDEYDDEFHSENEDDEDADPSYLDKNGAVESSKGYNDQQTSNKKTGMVNRNQDQDVDVSMFSIEKRKDDNDDEIMHKSQSYSVFDISDVGAEAEVHQGMETIQCDNLRSPPELRADSDVVEALRIPGDLPRLAEADRVSASVKVGSQARVTTTRAKSKEESVVEERMQQQPGVKGPTKTTNSMASKVRVAKAWEVPGVGSYEELKMREKSTSAGSQVPQGDRDTRYAEKHDKEKIVLAVLDLLQGAAKKAQTKHEAEAAVRGHAIKIPSFRSGVSKRQAMAATGKMFMDMVPDYDPDFETALQFMRSNEWTNYGDEGREERGVSESKEDEAEINSSPMHTGTAIYSTNASSSVTEDARTSSSARPKIGKTYPQPRSKTKAFIDDSYSDKRLGLATAPPRHDTHRRPSPTSTKTATATSRTQSSSSASGPPNFEADKDLRSVNVSIELCHVAQTSVPQAWGCVAGSASGGSRDPLRHL